MSEGEKTIFDTAQKCILPSNILLWERTHIKVEVEIKVDQKHKRKAVNVIQSFIMLNGNIVSRMKASYFPLETVISIQVEGLLFGWFNVPEKFYLTSKQWSVAVNSPLKRIYLQHRIMLHRRRTTTRRKNRYHCDLSRFTLL